MCTSNRQDVSDTAAASAAGRELLTATLQRNPLVAFGAALIGPIVGLFKSRRYATQIEKVKLESFRSSPVNRLQAGFPEASSKLPRSYTEPTARKRPPGAGRTALTSGTRKGGYSHG
jgi:hypothetical protein